MSCNASKETQPTTSLNVENFIEGEASPAVVNAALKAVQDHSAEFKAAGVTDVRILPFLNQDVIAIEPVGGNKEKSDAAVAAIARDLKSKGVGEVELGAIYRCMGSPAQVIIDARPPEQRTR